MFDLQPPEDDGLIKADVGPWSRDKHHFLQRYIDAFTTAMKVKKWGGLHYIDLFAGPGIEKIREGGLDWGSPLIAAQAPYKFAQLHLCERDKSKHDALVERLGRFPQPNAPQIFNDDANVIAKDVINATPHDSLSLAFLDPTGLHLHFETLRTLSERRVDFIIFFPDHLDVLRNWEYVYKDQPNSNLDRVLGGAEWLKSLHECPKDRRAEALTDIYVNQIKKLGYEAFDYERISREGNRYLYKLIFCTRHEAGLRIWRNISRKKADGQTTLPYD